MNALNIGVIDYEFIFNEKPTEDRLSLIENLCKERVLVELSALNQRLLPWDKFRFDNDEDIQIEQLKYFARDRNLLKDCARVASKYENRPNYGVLFFTREASLFAIEEIRASEAIRIIDGFRMSDNDYVQLFKYLLAVNYRIEELKGAFDEQYKRKIEESKINHVNLLHMVNSSDYELLDVIDEINIKNLPWNELLTDVDHLTSLYRGYCLIDFWLTTDLYKEELISYMADTYNIQPHEYILWIYRLYHYKRHRNVEDRIYYFWDVENSEKEKKAFFVSSKMSLSVNDKRANNYSRKTEAFIATKKFPLTLLSSNLFILSDNKLLMDKCYSQLINDFWFDKLKKDKEFNSERDKKAFKTYKSYIGKYHEQYVRSILKGMFNNYSDSCLLMFDELENTKEGTELTDVYLRKDNKIFIGEAKGGSIYDNEKFGGSLSKLYNMGRGKFFKDFGVYQLSRIINELEAKIYTFDIEFPKGENFEVYPAIIVNDKIFQTAYWEHLFNLHLQELLDERGFDRSRFELKPLRIIFINDLERIEVSVAQNPNLIWELLDYGILNQRHVFPFYITVDQFFPTRVYPDRITNLYSVLDKMYD